MKSWRELRKATIQELISRGLTKLEAMELMDRGWKMDMSIGIPYDKPTIAEPKEWARVGRSNY